MHPPSQPSQPSRPFGTADLTNLTEALSADEQDAGAPAGALTDALAEYLALSNSLKRLPGTDFEDHDHPAVVLDRATGPTTRVWGWWADNQPPLPCLLWVSERGWSATVVEPDALDSEGYERAFWSHRVNLLDIALACALGPYPTLDELEEQIAIEGAFGFGERGDRLQAAVHWGIVQLRAAQSARGACPTAPGVCPLEGGQDSVAVDLGLPRRDVGPGGTRSRIFWLPGRRSRRGRRRTAIEASPPGESDDALPHAEAG